MKKILECEFICDVCKTRNVNECLPYGWYSITSKVSGFDFNLCRECADQVHMNLTDLIQDYPVK